MKKLVAGSAWVAVACLTLLPAPTQAGTLSIPFFSQKDKRWAKLGLGTSPTVTIEQQGCAVACMAMALRFRGADADPGKLNRFLADNKGFQDQVLIKWNVAAGYKSASWMKYDGASSLSTPAALKAQVDGRRIVIVTDGAHFVIVRGYTGTATQWSDFLYWDPLDQTAQDRRGGGRFVIKGQSTRVFSY